MKMKAQYMVYYYGSSKRILQLKCLYEKVSEMSKNKTTPPKPKPNQKKKKKKNKNKQTKNQKTQNFMRYLKNLEKQE
jgi:hypothetical protein